MNEDKEDARLLEAVYNSALAFMSDERQISNLQKAVNALKKYRKAKNERT